MTISQIMSLSFVKKLSRTVIEDRYISSVFGSDMISDVLSHAKEDAILVTGLNNMQVIRAAEMTDIRCLIFANNRIPEERMLKTADELGIGVLATSRSVYETCGLLYQAGLSGQEDLCA